MTTTVLSAGALRFCLEESLLVETIIKQEVNDPRLVAVRNGDLVYVVHEQDDASGRIVVFGNVSRWAIAGVTNRGLETFLERAAMFCERSSETRVRIPSSWGQWKSGDLVAFFAAPRDREYGRRRWISQVRRPSGDVCFWELYDRDDIDLSKYLPDDQPYFNASAARTEVSTLARARFAERQSQQSNVSDEIGLFLPAIRDVTRDLGFDEWQPHLQSAQRDFIDRLPRHSLQLTGPAGSGKTLTLELKAIREVRRLRNEGRADARILFVTHSWAMAGQVDAQLAHLDASASSSIEVLPLLAIAQDTLPSDRRIQLEIVGEDSLSAKRFQLDRIAELVQGFLDGDWITFRAHTSPEFRRRMESSDSGEIAALCWDLLAEFGCVLGASGIFTGPGSEERYLKVPRTLWMMPLPSKEDRKAVYYLYREYVMGLLERQLMTNDQLLNDLLNYLETWSWNVLRRTAGYDLIFVDELHMFNNQERLVLRYLARQADEYPKMFMALDQSQAPWEFFMGDALMPESSSTTVDTDLGEIRSVALRVVYRFSPQILELVRHIHREFPSLGLAQDWSLGSDIESTALNGPTPLLVRCGSSDAEVVEALQRVQAAVSGDRAARTALAVLEEAEFERFGQIADGLAARSRGSVSILTSREDVETLNYKRPRLVVAPVEYLAGLQFDRVVIAALPDGHGRGDHMGHQRRRFLSLLYLGVSRAKSAVEILLQEENGVPEVLQTAVARRLVDEVRGRRV